MKNRLALLIGVFAVSLGLTILLIRTLAVAAAPRIESLSAGSWGLALDTPQNKS